MNKAKRYYNKFLHHHLKYGFIDEEIFSVLTTLTDEEITTGFSYSKARVTQAIEIMSLITKYQRAKLNEDNLNLLSYRNKLLQIHYLWSDAAFFKEIPNGYTSLQLGLFLLMAIDRRLAIVYALRLRVDLCNEQIKIEHPEYLQPIFISLLHKR
ncbi:hypothetical protein NUF46_004291 [Yersinia enterocolitica]|nr:hypothetical protein [Yersinia enterocolitica]